MSVETFDVKSELVTVTPAAAEHFRASLAEKGVQRGAHQRARKRLYRLQVRNGRGRVAAAVKAMWQWTWPMA